MKRLAGARAIIMDVHAVDSEQRQYNIEVQRAEEGADPERARYHSAALDVETLDAGDPFSALPETYVIFVTERDPFRAGMGVYPIERVNLATGMPFGDRAHIMYVNGQYRGDDALGRLMHDFLCSDPSQMIYKQFADDTRYLKGSSKEVQYMCKIMEELYKEAHNEGIEKGRLRTLFSAIHSLRTALGLSDDVIRKTLSISDEDWQRFLASNA